MKKLIIFIVFVLIPITANAGITDMYKSVIARSMAAGGAACAGGVSGDTGAPGANIGDTGAPNVATINSLIVQAFTIDSSTDGDVTRIHWQTFSTDNTHIAGIFSSTGVLLAKSSTKDGNNTSPELWDDDLDSTVCLADGSTYYLGVWFEADANAGAYICDVGSVNHYYIEQVSIGDFNVGSLTVIGASTRILNVRVDNAG